MTSSGSYVFPLNVGELTQIAFERIGVRLPELRVEHMRVADRELNLLFSEWSNKQVNLWEVIRTQTTLTEGDAEYDIDAKTIMILDASIVLNFGDSDESRRYITPISRTEYLSFSNQQIQGPPTVYWFNRQIEPTITFWPVPDDGGPYTFDYFSVTQIQSAHGQDGQTPDLPYRWFDAAVAGLAHRLARIYKPELEQIRKADAKEAWDIAAAQDTENVGVQMAPQLYSYYRI